METILPPLGRLEKVDLRTYWSNESRDFTPWLAKEENIDLLGSIIGLELEVQGIEQRVGPFSADILCKDRFEEKFVLIENQLEKTDHIHLGQLLTYAAGLDAAVIIWIAQKFSDEHRAALDWLNEITNQSFSFFGIEIELYRIGVSSMAPNFNVVCKPNDWTKRLKREVDQAEPTNLRVNRLEYWTNLKAFFERKPQIFRSQKPSMDHWTNITVGHSSFRISINLNSRLKTIGIWFEIRDDEAKSKFDYLRKISFDQASQSFETQLVWDRNDGKKTSLVCLTFASDFQDKSLCEVQFAWLEEHINKYIEFFKPLIPRLLQQTIVQDSSQDIEDESFLPELE